METQLLGLAVPVKILLEFKPNIKPFLQSNLFHPILKSIQSARTKI